MMDRYKVFFLLSFTSNRRIERKDISFIEKKDEDVETIFLTFFTRVAARFYYTYIFYYKLLLS